ncbi:barstar family protein [Streptomyces nigrescens]|uniref:barstar family protein n=1 Tax=Streptomyces nigrescens TaxID=1920 RepID=UPI003701D87C
MTAEESWIPFKPWLHLVGPDAHMPVSSLVALPGLTFSAWMNGSEMKDPDAVFQQFWDGFKLPDYFGWNFPALNDCLRDLGWLSADQYVLFIEKAHEVLIEDPEARKEFFELLLRVGERWSFAGNPKDAERARFQIVLGCSQSGFASMHEVIHEG